MSASDLEQERSFVLSETSLILITRGILRVLTTTVSVSGIHARTRLCTGGGEILSLPLVDSFTPDFTKSVQRVARAGKNSNCRSLQVCALHSFWR